MTVSDKEFNILYEPWICVMDNSYNIRELSVMELFEHAQEYQGLKGELPTQDIAVMRFLLAILHTVFSRFDLDGQESAIKTSEEAINRWRKLWERGSFPVGVISKYLKQWEERFYLFHPQRPFYQVLEASYGEKNYKSSKLNGELLESSNRDTKRFFSVKTGAEKDILNYGEAVRWLININAYDDAALKNPSMGVGWLGQLGLIIASGNNLFETLMLNLILLKDGNEIWAEEKPEWELDEKRVKAKMEIALPNNLAQLYTLQSRRLLLLRENNLIVEFKLLGGDFFDKTNAFSEQMTVWKRVKGKAGVGAFIPETHKASKQFWRKFPNVFEAGGENHRPGVVTWIGLLKRLKIIEREKIIVFKIASVQYDEKNILLWKMFLMIH